MLGAECYVEEGNLDVKRFSTQGGSLRIYVEKKENVSSTVREMLRTEAAERVDQIDYYRDFAEKVAAIRTELRRLLQSLKERGARIAAYGAAAKGSTMISYCGIGSELVDLWWTAIRTSKDFTCLDRRFPCSHLRLFSSECRIMFYCSLGTSPTRYFNSRRNINSAEDALLSPSRARRLSDSAMSVTAIGLD